MSVDGSIPGSSSEVLSFSVGNMFSVSLDVSLGKTEIKEEDFVGGLVKTYTEVIRFNIPVNEISVMDVFNSGNHLVDEHENSFETEFSESLVEERFKGWAHEIHDEDVIVTFCRAVVDVGDSLVDDCGIVMQVVV